jgi:ParB family transcriptional regulator, chromosome partitioning protein
MIERKSRFGDRSALPEDPALRVLALRPRGEAKDPTAPITYPGRLAAQDQQGLVGRLQQAREETTAAQEKLEKEQAERERERTDGLLLLRLDPESIGLTEYANRHELSLLATDEKLKSLKASIKTNGQDTPVRVRPAAPGSARAYELVEGHRRHAVIRELNREIPGGLQILARLDAKAVEAKDLVLKMYRENADREDLSAYETGTMFAQWLATEICKTQRELAGLVGLKENTVSQYLTIASLPAEIVSAFGDVRLISVRWATALAGALKDHPTEALAQARKLAKRTPRPEAQAVYEALTTLGSSKRAKRRGEKVSDTVMVNDKVLFKIALKDGRFTINPRQVEAEQLRDLYEDLKAFADKWLKTHGAKE